MFTRIKQALCKHYFRDVTTDENKKVPVYHWQCINCLYVASLFRHSGSSIWTFTGTLASTTEKGNNKVA